MDPPAGVYSKTADPRGARTCQRRQRLTSDQPESLRLGAGVLVRLADLGGTGPVRHRLHAGRRAPRPPRRFRRTEGKVRAGPDGRVVADPGNDPLPRYNNPGSGAGSRTDRTTRIRLRRRAGRAADRADPQGAAQFAAAHHRGPAALRRQAEHRVLRPARAREPGRHLAAQRSAARWQGAGPVAGTRWRVDDRVAPSAGVSVDEPSGFARLGVRIDELPRFSMAHLARPHRRRQAGAGVGQGEHRPLRRGPRLRRDQRRVRRWSSVRAGCADPERPQVPAGLRRGRHVGGGRRPVLRPLRLVLHRCRRARSSSSRCWKG